MNLNCMKDFSSDILALILSVLIGVRGDDSLREITIHDIVPVNYDYLRPPMLNDTPVLVNITVRDLNIRSIDESDMSFTVAIEIWQAWYDIRLKYPEWAKEKYQILDSTWITKLWNPNLYFPNAVEGKVNNIITPSSFFWMGRNREIIFCCRLVLKLICEMNLVHFPHDEQRCGVKMASAIFPERILIMEWMNTSITDSQFSSLQQFEILRLEKNKCQSLLGPSKVSCLEEAVILRRRGGYYLINVYIPTVLIVVMSMLTFWIPHDAVPARVTLGVTSLLTIITKQYQASMPSVSYIVALNVWLSCCIAFVFFSLLEFATVIALSSQHKEPTNVLQHNSDHFLPMVMLKANGTWATKHCWSHSKVKHSTSKRLDFCSRLFFPTSFFIFVICYWRYYS